MNPLLTTAFWFDPTPIRLMPVFEKTFFVLFALLLITATLLRILGKNSKDKTKVLFLHRWAVASFWMGLWGFFWLFCTFEEVQFFGMRFWMALWVIVAGIIAGGILWYSRAERRRAAASPSSHAPNPYLPRAKWRR
jgi:hypothetical protein